AEVGPELARRHFKGLVIETDDDVILTDARLRGGLEDKRTLAKRQPPGVQPQGLFLLRFEVVAMDRRDGGGAAPGPAPGNVRLAPARIQGQLAVVDLAGAVPGDSDPAPGRGAVEGVLDIGEGGGAKGVQFLKGVPFAQAGPGSRGAGCHVLQPVTP